MARILLLTLSCALLLTACGEKEQTLGPPAAAFDIVGTWEGSLEQRDMDPFTVRATIRDLEADPAGAVRYSGLDCRGEWTYLGKRGEAFRFREVIDSGRSEKCKGRGEVVLTPDVEKLDYVFTGGGVESRGTITRE
ncbi:MAG: hypothetical protein H0V29_14245 [Thermoleophilaceae bacterium]|nr:hypothetical protein [Thermoleophilaceae bacterium]